VKHFINDPDSIVTEAIDATVMLGEGKLARPRSCASPPTVTCHQGGRPRRLAL
jgi:hypothetical protein